MPAKNNIGRLCDDAGITPTELARHIGMSGPALRRYVRGELTVSIEIADKVARYFGVTVEEVIGRPLKSGVPAAARIPLYGSAQGGAGADITDVSTPIETIPAPEYLRSRADSYAVYCVGGSMEPRYFAGEILFVDPHRPPRRDDYVVVQLKNGGTAHAMVKRFVSRNDKEVVLEQHNPSKEIRLAAKTVVAIHRVVGAQS